MRRNLELERLRPDHWWQDRPEEVTELSEHILNRLIGAGFHTVAEVRDAGPERLRQIEGIGNVALEEIKNWLRRLDGESD